MFFNAGCLMPYVLTMWPHPPRTVEPACLGTLEHACLDTFENNFQTHLQGEAAFGRPV